MNRSTVRSLLIKAGLLGITVGLTIWVGWHGDETLGDDPTVDRPMPQDTRMSASVKVSPAPSSGRPAEPAQGQSPPRSVSLSSSKAPAQSARLDLNRATAEELQNLPGIGAVLAQRMVERRQTQGRYRTIDDLRDVKGIGAKRLDRLRPLVVIATKAEEPRAGAHDATEMARRVKGLR